MGNRRQSLAQLERDAAIARIGRARVWAIAAATALTAGFAAIVAAVAPGRSLAARSHTAPATASRPLRSAASARAKLPPLQSASTLGLGGPPQAPQASAAAPPAPAPVSPSQSQAAAPVQAGPPVVSGGS